MFISYAQNNEDVILHRAFKDIKNGFYVDVGANDPSFRSVTKAFYDMGWNGINIDPDPLCFEKIRKERDRDINLNIGIGRKEDELTFYQFDNYEREGDTALSTLSKEVADHHKSRYGMYYKELKVKVLPIKEVFKKYLDKDQEINFMNIDVEGWEHEVLLGMDFNKYRPKVFCIESSFPVVHTPTYLSWEYLLHNNEYEFVYFDGLNRFYLDKRYLSLKRFFDTPINVFDQFKTHYIVQLEDKIKYLESLIKEI